MPHLDGDRVRDRAAQMGYTLGQLADRMGISRGTMRNVVAGRSAMHLVRCYRLLKILNPPGVKPLVLTDIIVPEPADLRGTG